MLVVGRRGLYRLHDDCTAEVYFVQLFSPSRYIECQERMLKIQTLHVVK